MNGIVLGVLKLGTAATVLVRGVQDSVAGSTGSTAETTVAVLHHLPRHTQRMELPRPSLKGKAAVPDFGLVWPQEV